MNRPRMTFDVADGAMLATALIWAGNNVIMKAVLNERIAPLPYVLCRFAIVVALLFLLLQLRGADLGVRREDLGRFLLTGLSGYAAYNLLFTVGLAHTSAFSAAMLISLGPVFALVFAAAIGIERVRRVQWIGVACACVGIAVFVGGKPNGESPAIGDVLSLLGAASFAIYSLATRPLVRRYGSPTVTAWSALVGLVAVVPITLPAMVGQDWGGVGVSGWAALLYSSAISMLVAYTIWGWAIERRGVGRTVPYLYLIPIVTGALALLFLNERFGLLKLVGAALVLAGVGLARRGANRREAAALPPIDRTQHADTTRAAAYPAPTPGP